MHDLEPSHVRDAKGSALDDTARIPCDWLSVDEAIAVGASVRYPASAVSLAGASRRA